MDGGQLEPDSGGGAGNLIDRLFREGGYVVDLFDFRLINFPVFNVADICVTVGMALFLIYFIFIERKEHRRFEIRPGDQAP